MTAFWSHFWTHWNPASFRNLSYLGICCSKSLQQELPRIGEFFFITVNYSFVFVAIFFKISPENAYNSKIKSTRKKAVWKLSFLLRHFIFVLADVYDPLLRIRVSLTCILIHPQPHVNKHIRDRSLLTSTKIWHFFTPPSPLVNFCQLLPTFCHL